MKLYFLIVSLVAAAQCQQIQARYSVLAESNKQAVAEALAKFTASKADAAKELMTLVDSTRLIQTVATDLKTNFAPELILARFHQGFARSYAAFSYALQQNIAPFVTKTMLTALDGVGEAAVDSFFKCYESNLANDLSKVITSAPQKLAQLTQEEAAFKTELAFCPAPGVIASGKAKECIGNVLLSNPYPTVVNTTLQTTQSMNKLIGCLASTVDTVSNLGNRGIGVYKEWVPEELHYLVKDKFENDNATPIAFPSSDMLNLSSNRIQRRLNRFKAGAELANKVLAQAAAVKGTNIESAYSFLAPKLRELNDFIDMNEGSASPMVLPCYGSAKAFKLSAIQSKANNLVNCIATAGQVPNALAIAAAEATAKDIESKEKAFWSAIECSRKLSNILNMDNFYQCLDLANNATVIQLTVLDIQVRSIAADGAELLHIAERCKCQAAAEFQREVRTALYKLRECVITTGKVRTEVPQQSCAVSTCV